jgi:hypothetical protein
MNQQLNLIISYLNYEHDITSVLVMQLDFVILLDILQIVPNYLLLYENDRKSSSDIFFVIGIGKLKYYKF